MRPSTRPPSSRSWRSYRDILAFFFPIHDPTTKDRQGNDIGSSYRSEIFATSDEQRQVAEETIADVEAIPRHTRETCSPEPPSLI